MLVAPALRAAESLASPTGPIILDVTGAIERTNAPGRAQFDRQMLEALGVDHLTTTSTWTDGKTLFEGVSATKLLAAVGAHGKTVVANAKDDYRVDIPVDDFEKYPVLLAWAMNGKDLPRDKAPIWIIYPRDDYPELNGAKPDLRWVWQVLTLDIK
jgi:hypothetical protein